MNEIVNIKGTKNGLVICLDSKHEFEDLKKTLNSKIESARGFFKGAKFTFHLDINSLTDEKTRELEEICCGHGLVPNSEINWHSKIRLDKPRKKLLREASPFLPSVGVTQSDKKPCLLVSRSLRSGQKINFDGSVVITGDVNPGSEIIATGDIVVAGSLRGLVHAGADGDSNSIIMAYRLNPVQLRIATTIGRPPENSAMTYFPEIARLNNMQIVIEPYLTHGLKQ